MGSRCSADQQRVLMLISPMGRSNPVRVSVSVGSSPAPMFYSFAAGRRSRCWLGAAGACSYVFQRVMMTAGAMMTADVVTIDHGDFFTCAMVCSLKPSDDAGAQLSGLTRYDTGRGHFLDTDNAKPECHTL